MLVPLAAAHGLTTGSQHWFVTGQLALGYFPFNQAVLAPPYHISLIRCSRGTSIVTGFKVLHTLVPLCSLSYLSVFPNMDLTSSGEVLISL